MGSTVKQKNEAVQNYTMENQIRGKKKFDTPVVFRVEKLDCCSFKSLCNVGNRIFQWTHTHIKPWI